jgi:hypothetical protein
MGAVHESDERFPPPLCHPGTRDVVVDRAIIWYLDKSGQRKGIMWVHAPAGFGKTAVAGTVTEKLRARAKELGFNPIGATFFFWRTSPERNSPARFIITLAYQLAESIPELRPHVEAVIKTKPGVVKMALELQLAKLIVEPLQSLPNLDAMPNRLVIIDGIDECINSDREFRMKKQYAEDQEAVQIRVLDLIRRLQSYQLPLSFLILSRPEAWIKQHLASSAFREVVEPLDLYEIGDHMNDVAKFVRAEFSRIATTHGLGKADEEWSGEQWLVRRSEGQMVYVSTVICHIDDPYDDPRQLLKDIIDNSSATSPDISHSTPFSSLYELYAQIMRSCPHRTRAVLMEVLGDILSNLNFEDDAYEAALGLLDRFWGRPLSCGMKTLRPLYAVLRHQGSAESISIHPAQMFIHSSFTEFLQSPHASGDFYVNVRKRQVWILSKMLDCMASITFEDVIEKKPDDIASFSSANFWIHHKDLAKFFESKTTYMTKLISVDLRACIIDYFRHDFDPIFRNLEASMMPSRFLVSFIDLDPCEDALSTAVDKVNSHWQSSFEGAFLFMLQPNVPLNSLQFSMWAVADDIVDYLHEVATQSDNWKEHKLIQALGAPEPDGLDLFEEVVKYLYEWIDEREFFRVTDKDGGWCYKLSGRPRSLTFEEAIDQLCEPLNEDQQWAWDILEYLYEAVARDHNPILEAEYHPFSLFLYIREKRRARAATQDMLPPILDIA